MKLLYLLFILLFEIQGSVLSQVNQNFISIHLKNETFQNGRLFTLESDYFFDTETGNLVVTNKLPKNHIKISNRLGEVKVYYPDENKVNIKQSEYFSSENELVYYFLSNKTSDLGLAREGFTVTDTRMEGSFQVVTWDAPVSMNSLSKVELVFEDGQPVFAGYYNRKGALARKIYYYNYEFFSNFILPMKVTQITYTPEGDSIIQRNTWSSLHSSPVPQSGFFNFKIPEDAVVID